MKKSILLVMIVALAMICIVGSAVAEVSTSTGNMQVNASIAGCQIGITVPADIESWSLNRFDSSENQNYVGNVAVASTCAWTITASDNNAGDDEGHMMTSGSSPVVLTNPVKIYDNVDGQFEELDDPVQIGSGSGNGAVPVYLRQVVDPGDEGSLVYSIIITFTGSTP
jgi:hypothetical protein